jgi:hypothetical protein
MIDSELKELAEKVWNQYWGMTMYTGVGSKLPKSAIPIVKLFFQSGFIEGFRTKEELADK